MSITTSPELVHKPQADTNTMPSNLIDISSVSQWNQSLKSATAEGRTVVVDFWAAWCAPCKAIAPVFAQFAETYPQVNFLRVDVDAQKSIATKYNISAMPTFLAFKSGKVIDMVRGTDPRGLQAFVKKHAPPLPDQAEEAKLAGNEYFKKGEFNEAVEKYTIAISTAPTSAPLFANRSISYLKSTPPNVAAAVEDARRATILDPKWGKGWVRLGDALLENGAQVEEVKASYEKGLGLIQESGMRNETEEKLKRLNISAPI